VLGDMRAGVLSTPGIGEDPAGAARPELGKSGLTTDEAHQPRDHGDDDDHEADPEQELGRFDEYAQQQQDDSDDEQDHCESGHVTMVGG